MERSTYSSRSHGVFRPRRRRNLPPRFYRGRNNPPFNRQIPLSPPNNYLNFALVHHEPTPTPMSGYQIPIRPTPVHWLPPERLRQPQYLPEDEVVLLDLDPYPRVRNRRAIPVHRIIQLLPERRFQLRYLPEDEVILLDPIAATSNPSAFPVHRLMPERHFLVSDAYEYERAINQRSSRVYLPNNVEEMDRREEIAGGLSEETIREHLKTRRHVSSSEEEEICVVCQSEYEKNESIGSLECGHEFHEDCINKWQRLKNVCPICKAKAF